MISVLSKILEKWNLFTNQRYWYQVQFVYYTNGVRRFDWFANVGVANKSTTIKLRELKKALKPLHNDKRFNGLLSNGTLDIIIISYLGKF